MRDGEGEPCFTALGENRRERVSTEIVELIEIKVEILSFDFGQSQAPHRRGLKTRDDKRTYDVCLVFADVSFREVGYKYPSLLHDRRKIDCRSPLPEDIAKGWRGYQ